ncbi:MAG: phosphoglucomutase/phosphomannomutase family protein [Bacteroidota bacterium]|nr:phosphoglucomutase/phosphomannomutase family protein [Bacteroidota bacterium]
MDSTLRFGTDGWRAVVAREFTFANLTRMARATAAWLRQLGHTRPKIVLGYDGRFMGSAFAGHTAQELVREGARVILSPAMTPTPAVSWATQAFGAQAGIVITASHNPAEYNGFKIKASFGGPATVEMIAAVEREVRPLEPAYQAPGGGELVEADLTAAYLAYLESKFDLSALKQSGLCVAHDAMFGAGQGLLSRLLGADSVHELHSVFNPGFEGIAPEPIERNLGELRQVVPAAGLDIGIANDGDADRIGVVDEKGRMVTSHMVMALLARYLHQDCGISGTVLRTFATSAILEKMGRRWGLPVETLPIGFKYIAPRFLEIPVLIGGEESGGIAVAGHICERDGIYVGLLLLDMLHRSREKLSALVDALFSDFGPHAYHREDVRTSRQKAIVDRFSQGWALSTIAGRRVRGTDRLDGVKHLMADAWLLVRASGTEPVLRIYAEAPTRDEARALVTDTRLQLKI